jgi:hypothetical protein
MESATGAITALVGALSGLIVAITGLIKVLRTRSLSMPEPSDDEV